jgi:ABC-type dipeptide/oligopeptide/nickel transport system permease component
MLRFLAQRLALAVPTLVLASMIIFALQQLLPATPPPPSRGRSATRR